MYLAKNNYKKCALFAVLFYVHMYFIYLLFKKNHVLCFSQEYQVHRYYLTLIHNNTLDVAILLLTFEVVPNIFQFIFF